MHAQSDGTALSRALLNSPSQQSTLGYPRTHQPKPYNPYTLLWRSILRAAYQISPRRLGVGIHQSPMWTSTDNLVATISLRRQDCFTCFIFYRQRDRN